MEAEGTVDNSVAQNDGATTANQFDDAAFRQSLGEYADKYKEFKTPADWAKGYDGLVRKLGQNPIVKPAETASDEEKNAYRNRLLREMGVPEKVDDYKFDDSRLPEDLRQFVDKNAVETFRAKAFELGVTPQAFNEMVAMQVQREVENAKSQSASLDAAREKGMAELKSKWGGEFDTKVKSAIEVAKKFYPDLASAETEVGQKYGNDPVIIQVLADMAAKMGETKMPPSSAAAGSGRTREDAKMLLEKANNTSLPIAEREKYRAEATKIYQELFSNK